MDDQIEIEQQQGGEEKGEPGPEKAAVLHASDEIRNHTAEKDEQKREQAGPDDMADHIQL